VHDSVADPPLSNQTGVLTHPPNAWVANRSQTAADSDMVTTDSLKELTKKCMLPGSTLATAMFLLSCTMHYVVLSWMDISYLFVCLPSVDEVFFSLPSDPTSVILYVLLFFSVK